MICQYLGLFCLYFGILTLTVFTIFHRLLPVLLAVQQVVYAPRQLGVHFTAAGLGFLR